MTVIIDETQPIGKINPQSQNSPSFKQDGTLFDDTVAIFDDPKALFGGQTTVISIVKGNAGSNNPNGYINRRR
jgi:hypothetical protein